MDVKEFISRYKYRILIKIIAVIAILMFYMIYQNNFSVCAEVQDFTCIGDLQKPDTEKIPAELKCTTIGQENCCRYIYPENQQCYHETMRQSIYTGYTGSLLIIFAEIFFLIAYALFIIFPQLTRFMVYQGGMLNGPTEAASACSDIFSKAIYYVTPILLILIMLALYRNLPFFIF